MAGEPSQWLKGVTWIVGLLLPLTFSGMGGLLLLDRGHVIERTDKLEQRVAQLEGVVDGLTQSVATTVEHVRQHEKTKDYWIGVIESNRDRLGKLSTDATARPDPFTGADGRAMRNLIDDNERRIDVLERCCAVLKGQP